MIRPSLGIYGPARGDQSGVTGYLNLLDAGLSAYYECHRINNDNYRRPTEFDYVLYNIGNNLLHRCAFQAMREREGPAILHEFICLDYYLTDWDALPEDERSFLLDRYSDELGLRHPLTSREDLLAQAKLRPSFDRFSCDFGSESLFLRFVSRCITHSHAVRDFLAMRYPRYRFSKMRFPVREVTEREAADARLRAGLGFDDFVFASFGYIGEYKRLEKVLEAWCRFEVVEPRGILILVGKLQYDLDIPRFHRIRHFGYLPDEDFFDALLVSMDCGIQLRHPCLGEASATAAKLRAHSIPLITSAVPFLSDLCGEEGVIGIEPDPQEVEQLVAALRTVIAKGRKSRIFQDSNAVKVVAAELRHMLEEV